MGTRWSILDLPPALREQAEAKIKAQSEIRTHDVRTPEEMQPNHPRQKPYKNPLIPKLSDPEERMAFHLKAEGIAVKREFQFAPPRKWRADFVIPEHMIAIEIEGGIWTGGRHVRPKSFIADCRKYSALVLAGWRLFRFTPGMVKTGEAIRYVLQAINGGRKNA